MEYDAFSICLNSLHFPAGPEDDAVWQGISAAGSPLIERLCLSLRNTLQSARDPGYRASALKGSIFVLCIPDGLVMLRCDPDVFNRDAVLSGFLIRRNESLRTAWNLVRWQLLMLCAAGWHEHGTVRLSPAEIDARAASVKFEKAYQDRLISAGLEMMSADAPYSFALTDYPLRMLPLSFRRNQAASADAAQWKQDGNAIVILPRDKEANRVRLLRKFPWIGQCLLVCTNRKAVTDMILAESQKAMDAEECKDLKAEIRDDLARYNADDIWCLRLFRGEDSYTEYINPATTQRILSGSVSFDELYQVILQTAAHAKEYYAVLDRVRQSQLLANEGAADSDDKKAKKHEQREKKQHFGILDTLLGRKEE